ncbi:MAG: DNRLRE domain-containing protein [Candidatus Coatesbacteria bacterium]|nr:MAG: DNRLRE domain-containing protein [Candidatus Coatesbacteria bacterium]
MKKTIPLVMVIVLAAVPALATTHSITIQPDGAASKDAGIWENDPNENYGDWEDLWTGYDSGFLDSLIKFDGLDAYAGVTVVYAELNLYCFDEWGPLDNNNRVLRVDNVWNENTVTWNNAPGFESTMWEGFNAPTVGDWLSVDVTPMVQSWLDGTYPHHGFYIGSGQMTNGGRHFYSGESAEDTLRPYIYMEYGYTGVTPASVGAIKAGFR